METEKSNQRLISVLCSFDIYSQEHEGFENKCNILIYKHVLKEWKIISQ